MRLPRRTFGLFLMGAGACLLAGPAVRHLLAQGPGRTPRLTPAAGQEAPTRREFTIIARDFQFTPSRIEATQDDLVKLTVRSEDVAYSLTIDAYRLSRRIPAGGTATIEFRTDRPGTFPFYSNLTDDPRHARMRGELVVRAR